MSNRASSRKAGGSHDKPETSIREKSYTSSDIYWDSGHMRGRCSVCGDQKQHRQKKNPKYFKNWYFRVFEKIDIFRGNDEYRGMICKQCIKDGKLGLVNKFHPNQLKDIFTEVESVGSEDTVSERTSDVSKTSKKEGSNQR